MATTSTEIFEVKGSYSFQIYPTVLIPTDFTGCTVAAIVDFDIAQSMADVMAKHVQVYPYLPAGSSNDPKANRYLVLNLADGNREIIGESWIRPDTITAMTSNTMLVKIYDTTANDVVAVRRALVSNGYSKLDISFE